MADIGLLKLLLPEYLVDYFEVLRYERKGEELHLYFEEKNELPQESQDDAHVVVQ